MPSTDLRDPQDLTQLSERGIALPEAERQLECLSRPAAWTRLVRPCTAGDGIERLAPAHIESLLARHAEAAAAGRVSAFVPASGAASRMFKDLAAAADLPGPLDPPAMRASPSPAARALARFVDELPRFAFAGALERAVAARGLSLATLRSEGPWRPLLEALLAPDGMDAAREPKGLLPFHRVHGEARTAFEEHLIESVGWASDAQGVRRLEVTVSPEHRSGFAALLDSRRAVLHERHRGSWDVRFTEQHPGTDTIAGDPGGGPFRDEEGRLLFRPAGHGALLRNLAESGGDLVFLKNIDNVAVARLRSVGEHWCRVLLGYAAALSEAIHEHWRKFEDDGWDDRGRHLEVQAFAETHLGLPKDARWGGRELMAWLDRPLRVCGMVPNTGEPGGGPFWVQGERGPSAQIVESAQVDPASPSQAQVFRAATHFNPVFMAVSLRDARGRPHDLSRYVDESAAIVTRKSHGGRELLALERPGLWNGSMAHWHTRFVEVPLEVFNPVKTVFDLLRPEHQGD